MSGSHAARGGDGESADPSPVGEEDDARAKQVGPSPLPVPPRGVEVEETKPSNDVISEADNPHFGVFHVARSRPFMTYFVKCSHDRFPEDWKPSQRVTAMKVQHSTFYAWVIVLDITLYLLGLGIGVFAALMAVIRVFFE